MKRRDAVKFIVLLPPTVGLLSSCNMEEIPVYENVMLEDKQYRLIAQLCDSILPTEGLELNRGEKTVDFVLTVLNDNHSPEDIEKYKLGLTEFQTLLKEKYGSAFRKMDSEKKLEVLTMLKTDESNSEALQKFYSITEGLTKEHFISSEYFMKNYLDFEFAPGRYDGAVELS